MPETIKLADGTEREVPTQEELTELQSRAEARKEQREKYKSELEQARQKLSKLENKDFNFKKLREMTDEERKKLSTTEMELKQKQEQLEEQQQSFTKQIVEGYQNESLAVLVGDDAELRKKVMFNYNRISDEAKTKDQVLAKMRDAYHMSSPGTTARNPLRSLGLLSGENPVTSKAGEKIDPNLAKAFGVSEDDIKKYSK